MPVHQDLKRRFIALCRVALEQLTVRHPAGLAGRRTLANKAHNRGDAFIRHGLSSPKGDLSTHSNARGSQDSYTFPEKLSGGPGTSPKETAASPPLRVDRCRTLLEWDQPVA